MRYSIAVVIGTLLIQGAVTGQEPPQPTDTPVNIKSAPQDKAAQPAPSSSVREEEPAVYLLPDGEDNYKPVINFPLEKFKQLLELERQVEGGTAKPTYAIEMTGDGVADGSRVRLSLEFQVTLPEDGWVRIPLRMDEAVLLSQRHVGPGEHVVVPVDEGRGYVAWFRGRGKEPHRLSISAVVPIERAAGESRFRLSLPRLTTSELKLRVPIRDAVVRTSLGVELERLSTTDAEGTLVRALGTGNSLDLSWRESNTTASSTPAVLSALGTLDVQADGRAATTTAQLTVTTTEGTIDRFGVLLPPGATLVAGRADGYSVSVATDAARPPERTRLDVAPLSEPTKQVVLKLVTEQTLPDPGAVVFVDLAGFDVVGARQQTGFLALRVVGDWQVVFGDRRNVREVPIGDLPAELRTTELLAGFEYLAQPSLLSARVVPRRPRVAVEPQFVYSVTVDSIELDARLRYTVRGARVFALEVEFPDESWEIVEIGPAGLVDLDGVLFEQLQPLSVPLLQPGNGELELRIRARRRIDPAAGRVEFALPRPLANSVGPATVVVVPADNVELVPRSNQIVGMARYVNPVPIALPPHQQEALIYRGEAGRGRFSADHQALDQEVSARISSQIHLEAAAASVEQRIRYTIANQPLERIALICPRGIAGAEGVEFSVNGEPVQPVLDRESEVPASDVQRVQLPLAKPHFGALEVRIRFPLTHQKLAPRISVPLTVPLVATANAAILSHEAIVLTRPGLEAKLRGGPWKFVDGGTAASDRQQQFRLAGEMPTNELALALNLEDPEAYGASVVDRAWIQTWLDDQHRRDRAVFRLNSRQPSLRLTLPDSFVPATLGVRVDGQRITVQPDSDGAYAIPLAGQNVESATTTRASPVPGASDEHVVELAYDMPRRAEFDIELTPPRFVEHTRVNQTYWQVIVPRHQHIVARNGKYGSEFTWGWQGYYWGRQPLLEAIELENWAGASHETPLLSTTNRYLCSALGPPTAMTVRIVPRWLVVLAASGTALVVGFGLIYLPVLRHPALLWIAAIAIVAAGIVSPEPTLMVLQAASLGVLLTLVAAVLNRWMDRRARPHPGSTLLQPGSSILRRRESETHFRSTSATGSNSSTDSGPLAGQLTGPESKL